MGSSMKQNAKNRTTYKRTLRVISRDSARVRVPRSVLPTLASFFRHVVDAMEGDDRPDHGLAMMRNGREYYRMPFLMLRHALARPERTLTDGQRRRGYRLLQTLMESGEAWSKEGRQGPQNPRRGHRHRDARSSAHARRV